MRAYERLLKYVRVTTQGSEESETTPSTECQFDLGRALAEELCSMGVANAECDGKCYIYASIPATKGCEKAPAVGFIAHVDTVPDFCGKDVCPDVIENYDGGEVTLKNGLKLLPRDFPHLSRLAGRTLIVTSGDTVLGADDKAGVSEIMTAVERIIDEDIPHGKICIGFTPDEEIGRGADFFDIKRFGADFAYTVDGDAEGQVVFENFNAASAVFELHGFNIHPGSAKDKMINAALVACEINSMLPSCETPRGTEGYEGFYHLTDMSGNVENATLKYIVRDHSSANFDARLATLSHIEKTVNEKYGDGTVKLTLREQYRNMEEKIRPCFHIVESAEAATRMAGIEPSREPIRGGTDGARLSFEGLPCPNLGTGGYAFHGPFEHITAEGMDKACEIIVNIVRIYSGKNI